MAKRTLVYDALERNTEEERHDWVSSAWSSVYVVQKIYDKCNNLSEYEKDVVGSPSPYGSNFHLTYSYDTRNGMTAIADGDDANYGAAVTCDENVNIIDIVETVTSTQPNAFYSHYEYDHFNRITQYQTKEYSTAHADWLIKETNHQYDGLGRLVKSDYTEYLESALSALAVTLGTTYELEHMYSTSGRHLGNYDGSSTYGTAWAWDGAANSHGAPLYSPNADTSPAQSGYNVAQGGGGNNPQRWTHLSPTVEGDERQFWSHGQPQAKDAAGSGTDWAEGMNSAPQTGSQLDVVSRLSYSGTVAPADMDRATDARQGGIGIFGSALDYAGSTGEVRSELLRGKLNPGAASPCS